MRHAVDALEIHQTSCSVFGHRDAAEADDGLAGPQIEAGVSSGEEANAKLLVNLVKTDKLNNGPLRAKILRLLIAAGVLILTLLYTTLIVVL